MLGRELEIISEEKEEEEEEFAEGEDLEEIRVSSWSLIENIRDRG